jgi:hypothetical protein
LRRPARARRSTSPTSDRLSQADRSDVVGDDGEQAVGGDDGHHRDGEVVGARPGFALFAEEHGVEEAGEDDGDQVFADGSDEVEDVLDVVQEHRDGRHRHVDRQCRHVELQVLPLQSLLPALGRSRLQVQLLRDDSVRVHLPVVVLAHAPADQVEDGDAVVPAAEEHECVGAGDGEQEADVDQQEEDGVGARVGDGLEEVGLHFLPRQRVADESDQQVGGGAGAEADDAGNVHLAVGGVPESLVDGEEVHLVVEGQDDVGHHCKGLVPVLGEGPQGAALEAVADLDEVVHDHADDEYGDSCHSDEGKEPQFLYLLHQDERQLDKGQHHYQE